jgi:hypothetical protein
MTRTVLIALAAFLLSACGGASKEPMHPDNETTAEPGDGGATEPAPAPK